MSNNTKHTPGPWKISGYKGKRDEDTQTWDEFAGPVTSITANKHTVCGTCDGCHYIDVANARLIAAAPELLEACKAALEALILRCPPSDDFGAAVQEGDIQKLRAAIAKAEGK